MILLIMLIVAPAGCERAWWNGFLDPSQVGRFREGAKRRAIQRTLSVLEEPPGVPGATEPSSEDLIVEYAETEIRPSDTLEISIFELLQANTEYRDRRQVNEVGYINVPEIGTIKVAGKTPRQLELDLADMLIRMDKLLEPQVAVTDVESQAKQYRVLGSVPRPGVYALRRPDFRLLDALTDVGGIPPEIKTLYVLRTSEPRPPNTANQDNLYRSDRATAPPVASEPVAPASPQRERPTSGENDAGGMTTTQPASTATSTSPGSGEPPATQPAPEIEPLLPPPATGPREPTVDELGALERQDRPRPPMVYDAARGEWVPLVPSATRGAPPEGEPSIQREERQATPSERPRPRETTRPETTGTQTAPGSGVDWESLAEPEATTRVIEVPIEPLLNGDQRYNIVVRPNDTINVAPGPIGEFYVMGNVLRPGAYTLSGRELGVREAIAAAGGFGPLATPSRAELIRRGPGDEEEIRSVDLDAIFAGEQDNFYLRPNDIINVGTNALMPFVATVRNAFRVSYGFGFVYDRNFADIDSFAGQQNPTDRRRAELLQRGFPP